jgi:hypothetical protein
MEGYGWSLVRDGVLDNLGTAPSDGANSQMMPQKPPSTGVLQAPVSQELQELRDIVRDLAQSKSNTKKNYAAALMSSIESFQDKSVEADACVNSASDNTDILQNLQAYRSRLHNYIQRFIQSLEEERSELSMVEAWRNLACRDSSYFARGASVRFAYFI